MIFTLSKSVRFSLTILLTTLFFVSCRKDRFGALQPSTVGVQVRYPSSFTTPLSVGAEVVLTNTSDGSVQRGVTGSGGEATFSAVLPGTYSATATIRLNEEQSLLLGGAKSAIQLTGSVNNLVVMNGQNPTFTIDLQLSALGGLVIKEVYYTASRTPSNGTYFSDQFVELYNNSSDTIYLDSLCIGDVYGVSGLINPTSLPTDFKDDVNHVYLNNIWQVPGSGKTHPLAPGKSIVIAQDGVNHQDPLLNPSSPVNLADADWETFNARADNRDADAPDVPNLRRVYFTGGFDWLLTVFGPGVVIFKGDSAQLVSQTAPIPSAPTLAPRIKIPNAVVIDAFEALRDGSSASFKRIPTVLDAGFVFADDTYNKQSFRRKTLNQIAGRRILQDSNNSASDFEKLSSPTPRSFQ